MSKKLLQAAAGAAAGEALYVEDVFSTYLYTGNGTARDINNGIDLDGEGGLVWIKLRSTTTPYSFQNSLFDTERGALYDIHTSQTGPSALYSNSLTSFNSDGFSLGTDPSTGLVNYGTGTNTYTSWTFRKQPGFFDVVTWTGDDVQGRSISHNLGQVPGCIIVKITSGTSDNWVVYHRSIGAGKFLKLNATDAQLTSNAVFPTTPTDSVFYVGNDSAVNWSGGTYVAYLFAHDAQDFGTNSDESIIKCGSAAATGLTTVDCGFEPQWVLIKSATVSNSWYIFDSMRGLHATGVGPKTLNPNLSSAEYTESADTCNLTSTGFTFNSARFNGNATYIYIAIRRPMKTPESGTEVFAIDQWEGATTLPTAKSGFPVDMAIWKDIDGSDGYAADRMRGRVILRTNTTGAETSSSAYGFDYQNGYLDVASNDATRYSWMFKRATGFFDVVAYTGTSTTTTRSHNLGAVPELIISKPRGPTYSGDWVVYHSDIGINSKSYLNDSSAFSTTTGIWGSSAPTTTTWTQKDSSIIASGENGIAYLFATLAGVSKVGSYTGNNLDTTIDCGFSNGARFVMIKRTDSTGDWTVFDAARGWSTSTDYWLDLNNNNAEASGNTLTVRSAGFGVRGSPYDAASLNVSGATYIYLAIA